MHKYIKYMAIAAAAAILPACNDDFDGPDGGNGNVASGELIGPGELEIAFELEAEEGRSRADFNTPKINDLWVGVFDLTSKKIIASQVFDSDDAKFDDPSSNHSGPSGIFGEGGREIVKLDNIYMNDNNPYVVIMGAANVGGVNVLRYLKNGEAVEGEISLADVLTDGIETLNDYANIAVDVKSAEKNAREGYVLMSGVYATSHGNFTIDHKDVISPNPTGSTTPIFEWSMFDETANTRKFDLIAKGYNRSDRDKGTVTPPTGVVHLRRLVNKISVEITPGGTVDGVTYDVDIDAANATFQVCNVPTAVYLQERSALKDPSYSSLTTWKKFTAAASDALATSAEPLKGYVNSEVYGSGESGLEDCFQVNDGEGLRVENGVIKFSYWHYENKHWGLSTCNTYHKRELRYDGTDIFSSLCPAVDKPWNNNAGYILLKAHVTDKTHGLEGDVEYLIHEGYCCQINSLQAASDTEAATDFGTFRNTNYTYRIQVLGLDNIRVKATKDGEDYNPGASGSIWDTVTKEPKQVNGDDGGTFNVYVPAGPALWAIDYEGTVYGVPASSTVGTPFYNVWNSLNVSGSDNPEEFPDELKSLFPQITLGGSTLDSYSGTEVANTPLVIPPFDGTFTLYLATQETDGRNSYYSTVTVYRVVAGILASPEITMPYASSKRLVMGVDDHTIAWDPVPGATSYTITLVKNGDKGGYSVTIPVNGVNKDSDDYETPLVTESDGKLSFRMRYANSQHALLSFLQSDTSAEVTIEVTANKDEEKSEPGKITFTIVNPIWNFSTSAWQNAVNALTIDSTGVENGLAKDQTVTIDGLTMYTGNNNKMTYRKYGNNYGFRPNGTGSKTNRGFKFHACAKGKLSFWSSHYDTKQRTEIRYIMVDFTGNPGSPLQSPDANKNISTTFAKIGEVANVDPTNLKGSDDNVWIYNSADFVIFQIQFTPQDR